jgi:hypothetical protein
MMVCKLFINFPVYYQELKYHDQVHHKSQSLTQLIKNFKV